MKKLFYIKEGRKYVPISEYDSDLIDAFTKGTHLVQVYPGGQSRRYNIDPAYAPMIAAGRVCEDAISRVIMEKSALRIPEKHHPITEDQKAKWEALAESFGEERFALEWCSYREAAEAGVKAMMDEAEILLTNPAVKKAWDNFMLVCKLTKESSK